MIRVSEIEVGLTTLDAGVIDHSQRPKANVVPAELSEDGGCWGTFGPRIYLFTDGTGVVAVEAATMDRMTAVFDPPTQQPLDFYRIPGSDALFAVFQNRPAQLARYLSRYPNAVRMTDEERRTAA